MKKHQKHTKLTRPNTGTFARNEWSIIGTPCGSIKNLAFQLTAILSKNYKVAYVEADHNAPAIDNDSAMAHGATMEYVDKVSFHRFDTHAEMDSWQFKKQFNEQDVVLVNGNHFKANNQIVVIDPKKEASLQKKLDRLDNVSLILLAGETEIYPFLAEHLKGQEVPVLPIDAVDEIANFLLTAIEKSKAPVMGLVLAGGKSVRMGRDKGEIDYHGKPQREYAADLLKETCTTVFISCREDQLNEIESEYELLADTFTGLGPYGAILTAFRAYPNHAWLVIACDLPLLNAETIQFLYKKRNVSKIATAYNSPVNEFPEPLIAIWEPRSYSTLLSFLAQGYSCPRKVLINSEIERIEVADAKSLTNINNPDDLKEVKNKLSLM